MPRYVRRRDGDEEYSSSFLELFFDLVFVFAITQVSHHLLGNLSWEGAGQSALLLLVVWWAWQFTAWVTNELDPDSTPVRVLLLALMLASLLMAVAIPEAFGAHALLFAGSYVGIQVGRHLFLTFITAEPGTIERQRALHILIWFCASGVFWIAGGLADSEARTALWLAALALDYGGPLVTYRVPGLLRVTTQAWQIGSAHFAERFGLFVIIALGESIVIIGGTTAEQELSAERVAAFALAFLGTAALWWLYFSAIAAHFERALRGAADRTLIGRDVYAYGHVLLIAGIVLTAVGVELVIAHPSDELPREELHAVVAGPALYLLAQALLRYRMTRTLSPRRLGGAAACVAILLLGAELPALAVGALLGAVLVTLVVVDTVLAARRPAAT
jgi:low temperature requirement protein LtrA